MDAPRTPQEGLDFLASRSPSTVVLGLDRMHEALGELGHPELLLRSVQVGGTNGKGSTCAFLDSILRSAGHRVGLYTSPHLVSVNERIQVGGVPIDDETLGTRVVEVLRKAPAAMGATYFELVTLVALEHFARCPVEVAVLEVGLGGRLDATTAARPRLTAITRVGMDHMEFLGDTLEAIAREKGAILRKGVPGVVAEQRPPALAVLETCASWVGAPLLIEGRDFSLDGLGRYRGPELALDGLALALHGEHQHHNAAVAVTCAHLLEQQGVSVGAEAIRTGLQRTRTTRTAWRRWWRRSTPRPTQGGRFTSCSGWCPTSGWSRCSGCSSPGAPRPASLPFQVRGAWIRPATSRWRDRCARRWMSPPRRGRPWPGRGSGRGRTRGCSLQGRCTWWAR